MGVVFVSAGARATLVGLPRANKNDLHIHIPILYSSLTDMRSERYIHSLAVHNTHILTLQCGQLFRLDDCWWNSDSTSVSHNLLIIFF